jgi:cell division protein ZapE
VTPTEYYQRLVESDQIIKDDQQAAIVEEFQLIYDSLIQKTKESSLLDKLIPRKKTLIPGLYLWGQVGIGKTFLMDCFYYCIPFKNKLRTHFLKFMMTVHEQLKALQGEKLPLEKIAKNIAKEVTIICFDELVVNDIADAMLIVGLFKALYQQKICLTFTSNCSPDDLYLNNLQRDSFLPTIELIKKHSKVIHISSHTDYRLKNYVENTFYYSPLSQKTEDRLEQQFIKLSNKAPANQKPLILFDRIIKIKRKAGGVIWFNFLDICGVPRSKEDYLAITKQYHTIIISNVFSIQPEQNDLARSFINLVDILYDSHKKLILSADCPLEQLYPCGRMLFEFARTRSRLIEMQTLAWHKKCNES